MGAFIQEETTVLDIPCITCYTRKLHLKPLSSFWGHAQSAPTKKNLC